MKLTDQQDAAIHTTGQHLAVDAGAGAGKTFVLIERMIYLIEHKGVDLEAIVAITFTDLAAAEMKSRLRDNFRRRAEDPSAQNKPEIQNFWRGLQRRAESARISTIHGFCSGLLREHALRCGLDPNFSVLTESEAHIALHDIVRDTVHTLLDADDVPARLAAIALGPSMLRQQVARLVRSRYELRHMAERVPMTDGDALASFWMDHAEAMEQATFTAARKDYTFRGLMDELAAFDGACAKDSDGREVLRQNLLGALRGIMAGWPPAEIRPRIASLKDPIRGHKKANWPDEMLPRLLALQEEGRKRLPGLLVEPDDDVSESAALSAAVYRVFDVAAEAYDKAKRDRGALDFEDLIHRALGLLEDTSRPVLGRVQQGIRHLLVDEFQDTDARQFRIAELLALLADGGPGPELFIVGDAKQSIYGWRGADVTVFKTAQDQTGVPALPLNTNFRSSPQVLAFINDFFRQAGALCAVEDPYVPMRWHRGDAADPAVEVVLLETPPEGRWSAEERREAEAQAVAARIAALCDPSTGVDIVDEKHGVARKASPRDVAILLRGRGIAHAYERALQGAGLPYVMEAGPNFYERQEVKDFRNLLTVVADPWNEAALLAYLRCPAVGMADDDIYVLGTSAPLARAFHSGVEPEGLSDPQTLRYGRALLADLRARRHDPLPDFLDFALDRSAFEAIWLGQFMGIQKAANVRKVCDMAEGFAQGSTPGLGAFIRYLETVTQREMRENDAGVPSDEGGAVTLMTIHKSKGLEFPVVVLADLAAQPGSGSTAGYLFDSRWGLVVAAKDDAGENTKSFVSKAISACDGMNEAAEDMRVLYVAMTRARDYLLLPGHLPSESARLDRRSAFHLLHQTYDFSRSTKDGVVRVVPRGNDDGLAPYGYRISPMNGTAEAPAAVRENRAAEQVDWPSLTQRMAPLRGIQSKRRAFAVTELAAAMAQEPVRSKKGPHASSVQAMRRGTILHGILERWDFHSDPADLLRDAIGAEGLVPEEAAPLEEALLAVLKAMGRHELGQRAGAASQRVSEAAFLLRIDDALVEGSIDLLLDDSCVIDFKTGSPHQEPSSAYTYQVQLYALAMAQLRGKTISEGLLWYVDANEVQSVDLSAAAIEAAEQSAREAIGRLRSSDLPVDTFGDAE